MKWKESVLLIITDDDALVATLGGKLRGWGATAYHLDLGHAPFSPEKAIDIVLVDVRRRTEEALRRFNAIKSDTLFAETVLINSSGNISASIAGMRSGASDEVLVPFNTETLRRKLDAACGRSRNRRKKKTGRSLLEAFKEAMSAAAFAQAGEFETALDMLQGSQAEKRGKKKKKPER